MGAFHGQSVGNPGGIDKFLDLWYNPNRVHDWTCQTGSWIIQ